MSEALTSSHAISLCYVLLPFVGAAMGWITIRLIRILGLYPRKFYGIPPYFGWQGYFYRHKQFYLHHWSQGLLDQLANVQQIFEHISPEKLIHHQLDYLRPQLDSIVDNVMAKNNLMLWENLPILLKNRLYSRTHRLLPRVLDDIIEELSDGMSRALSFQALLEYAESQQPGVIEKIYREISGPSFSQIQYFCMGYGFLMGILQALISYHWQLFTLWYWVITATAITFGFYWVARKYLELTLSVEVPYLSAIIKRRQNMRRQNQEMALATILADQVFSVKNIAGALFLTDQSHQVQRLIKRRLSSLVEDADIRTLIQVTIGPVGYVKLKNTLTRTLSKSIMEPLNNEAFNQERSQQVNLFLQKQFHSLPAEALKDERNEILSPLSILGGMVGLAIGLPLGLFEWLLSLL